MKELIDRIWAISPGEAMEHNDGLVFTSEVVKVIEDYFSNVPESLKDKVEKSIRKMTSAKYVNGNPEFVDRLAYEVARTHILPLYNENESLKSVIKDHERRIVLLQEKEHQYLNNAQRASDATESEQRTEP